jgi:predicted SprT family Zn-dependent metalloprotease
MIKLSTSEARRVRSLMRAWAKDWGIAELATGMEVVYNSRLRRSLARCNPKSGAITLNPIVAGLPPSRFAEVLCHEAAHVASFKLFGKRAKPHGKEWRELIRRVGFEPRTRATPLGGALPRPRPALSYEHYCPVCQQSWMARRPVRYWRCGGCLELGLKGELVIHKRV